MNEEQNQIHEDQVSPIKEEQIVIDLENFDNVKTQAMAPMPQVKKGKKSKEYKKASKMLLDGIVPKEESAKNNCLFMTCCCCYYAFCCCLICEKSKSVTK